MTLRLLLAALLLIMAVPFQVAGPGKGKKGKKQKLAATGTVIPEPIMVGRFKKKPQEDMVGDAKSVAGDATLMVPFFRIKFMKRTGDASSQSAFMGSAKDRVSVSIKASLEGIEEETFQEITDLAYTDLLDQLREVGYQVLDKDDFLGSTAYQKYKKTYPNSTGNYTAAVPQDMGYPGFKGMGNNGGRLIADLKAGLLQVDYLLNFAAFGKSSSERFGTLSADLSVGQVAHVMGTLMAAQYEGAKCNSFNGCWGKMSNLRLGQVTYSTQEFGTFVDAMSKGAKAAQGAAKALSALTGGSRSHRSKLALQADAEKYKTAALEALREANRRYVQALKRDSNLPPG